MKWEIFKNSKITEGRFDNVDLGSQGINAQIIRTRRKMADDLESFIQEGEFVPNTPISMVITKLRGAI